MKFSLPALFFCLFLSVTPARAGDVNVSAAASLKEAFNELCDSFTRKHPGVKFFKNYGGSGQLAKQIENGAPCHVFIPANLEWMDYLKSKKLVATGSVATFTYNTLVFAGAPGKAGSLQDLVRLDRIALGSPKSVPAGEYAMEVLRKAGLDRKVEKKLVMAKDVREGLMYAERGEVDGAFVYRTDALQAKRARVLFAVPQELYPRVVYPMALTSSGARNKDAAEFFAFLQGSEARAVLARYGFALR